MVAFAMACIVSVTAFTSFGSFSFAPSTRAPTTDSARHPRITTVVFLIAHLSKDRHTNPGRPERPAAAAGILGLLKQEELRAHGRTAQGKMDPFINDEDVPVFGGNARRDDGAGGRRRGNSEPDAGRASTSADVLEGHCA